MDQHCLPLGKDSPRLDPGRAEGLLGEIEGWILSEDGEAIERDFSFNNFYETMAFVNALAWVAHREDHHPDLRVGYGHCLVRYSTHSVGGLTLNDFICAAKINALPERRD